MRTDKDACISAEKIVPALIVLILLSLYFLYTFLDFSPILQTQNLFASIFFKNNQPEWPQKLSVKMPLVLSWNPYFSLGTVMHWLQNEFNVSQCPFRCQYSDHQELASNASVIIFHIRDQLRPLPAHRDPNQLYTFFLLESPVNSGNFYKTEVPRDFFNITMTYRSDSDVLAPYDAFDELEGMHGAQEVDEEDVRQERWTEKEVQQRVAAKKGLAVQFVSNCHTSSRREKYVNELKRHMNVTQIGSCIQKGNCQGECSDRLLDSHFFYLAFENSVCRNYLTEKFWNVKRLIVPVVLSRKIFSGTNVPDDTYIAADDFSSAKALADYLKLLATNKQLYLRYLQWTRRFKKSAHSKEQWNPLCQLCKLAYERPRRQIADIVDFWEGGGQCQDAFSEKKLLHGKGE